MAKCRKIEPTWEIFRISARAIYLGRVLAPDEKKAVQVAIKEIPVSNPEHQIDSSRARSRSNYHYKSDRRS